MTFPMRLARLSHIHVALGPGFGSGAEALDPGMSMLENPLSQQ
jgi:hypothetical protein